MNLGVRTNLGWLARLTLSIVRLNEVTSNPQQSRALDFQCMLAERAAEGNVREVQWLISHTPTGYSTFLPQGAYAALFTAILSSQHAVCQLLLDWCNPNKEPMQLPMCKYMDQSVSFLGLAYESLKIQGKKQPESAGHYMAALQPVRVTGSGPLYRLPSSPYLGLLCLLLDYNASPTAGVQGLLQAIAWSADVEAIQLLLRHGLYANAPVTDGNTLLHLLVAGMDWTAYMFASHSVKHMLGQQRSRQIEGAVRTLLEAGANPTVRNRFRKTPLDVCVPEFTNIKAMLREAVQPISNNSSGVHGSAYASSGEAACNDCQGHASVMVLAPCGHVSLGEQCSHHAR